MIRVLLKVIENFHAVNVSPCRFAGLDAMSHTGVNTPVPFFAHENYPVAEGVGGVAPERFGERR